MKKIFKNILKVFNLLIPKNNKQIIFISSPDYSDNSKAISQYMQKEYENYKQIWIVNNNDILVEMRKSGIKCYKNKSIKSMFYIFTSRYILSTQNDLLSIKSKNQVYISLWHGMPLKTIYYLENHFDENLKKIDFCIATSNIMKLAMSSSFNIDPRKVIITGQPRTDKLFVEDNNAIKFVKNDIKEFDKLILYLPTYRNGAGRSNGTINIDNIINIEKYEEENLNEYLQKNNYLLLVKLHPAEESKFNVEEYSNIKILDSKNMNSNLVDINEILNLADLLVTDYSSVYFDYLLLDRPIIFTNMDEEEYIKSRGFIFDNIDFWRPGPKVKELNMIISEIERSFNDINYYRYERNTISSLINLNIEGNSSQLICEYIFDRD